MVNFVNKMVMQAFKKHMRELAYELLIIFAEKDWFIEMKTVVSWAVKNLVLTYEAPPV